MALAETANLAVNLTLGGNFNAGLSQAEAGLTRFNSTAATHTGRLGGAFASVGSAAGKMGGALSHAGSQIKGLLSGPLGLLGLGTGVFALGGSLNNGIAKAQGWGLQIEKLTGITHNSAEELSGLLAVTEKYGLANERLSMIAGFTEKTLGKMTATTGQAAKANDALVLAEEKLRVARVKLIEVESKHGAKQSAILAAQFRVVDAQRKVNEAMSQGAAATDNAGKFLEKYGFNILGANGKVKDFNTLLLTFSDYWKGNKNASLAAAAAATLFGRGYADLVPILNLGSKGIKDAEAEAAALGLTLTKVNVEDLAKMRENTRQLGDAMGGLELQIGLALIPTINDFARAASKFIGDHRTDIVTFFKNAADAAKMAAGVVGGLVGTIGDFWNTIPAGFRDLLVKGIVADRTVKFLFGFSPVETALKGLTGGLLQRGTPFNPMFVKVIGGLPGGGPPGGPGNLLPAAGGLSLPFLAATVLPIAAGLFLGYLASQDPQVKSYHDAVQPIGGTVSAARGGLGLANLLNDPRRPSASLSTSIDQQPGKLKDDLDAIRTNTAGMLAIANRGIAIALKGVNAGIAYDAAALADGRTGPRTRLVMAELKHSEQIAKSSESFNKKMSDLTRIQNELKNHGDRIAQAKIGALIAALKAKKLAITNNITTAVTINGRTWNANVNRYTTVVGSNDLRHNP